MKHFLISLFVTLALVTGLMSGVSVAYAQGVGANGTICDYDSLGSQDGVWQGGKCVSNGTYGFDEAAAKAVAAKTQLDYGTNKDNEAYNGIMMRIMTLFAWLVGVAAITLDNAVYYTVVTMGNYVGHLSAIGVTWRILRDIGNIALIFGFLGIGISVILNVNWYGGKTKMLPMLLVAAVFLNFSLFFTEAVIDTGNLFATQFYKQINGGNSAGAKNFDLASVKNDGISNKIMAQIGLQSIYGAAMKSDAQLFKGNSPLLIGFMGILLFIITAFVFFSLAFILIARFIYLIFLIIFAPIGFAGLAVPQLKARADKWWSALFAQTITAPVLLLLLYVALAVITDAQFLSFGGKPDWTGFLTNNFTGFASTMLSFFVAMGLLLLVTIQAKNLSAFGAGKATALAGKLTFGATAFGLRSTIGAGSQAASQMLRRTKFGATKYGRVASTTLDRGAKASFDIRGATAFGGLKGIGIDAGDAQKGGYREKQKKTIEGHKEYAKSLTDAIGDREQTGKERDAIAQAGRDHTTATSEHAAATQQRDAHKIEADRLAEELRRDPYLAADRAFMQRHDTAQQNLAASETRLTTATADLAEAAKKLKEAKEAPGANIKNEKATAQKTYAESIDHSIPGWVMYGAGGSKAANSIRAEADKSEDQKLLDALKKALNPTPPAAPPAGNPPPPPPAGGHP